MEVRLWLWIWVDKRRDLSIVKESIKFKRWPLLTKVELVAIWMALLVALIDLELELFTDSVAAIASLSRKLKLNNNHR